LVVADQKRLSKKRSEKPTRRERPKQPVQNDPIDDLDPSIAEQLARAKAVRTHAESARQKICSEIMDASKRLYQNLVAEGEQALERARQREAAAQFNLQESQRELQRSQFIRQEADAYRNMVITESNQQSQEIIQRSKAIKADAVAFREKLLLKIKQQADLELDQARDSRVDADAYRERAIAQAQRQANTTLERSRLTAEQAGSEIKLRYDMAARDLLAKAELIKAAAVEHLEAQRIYADAASLQSESREVLDQARSMVNQQSPLIGLISRYQTPAQANEQQPAQDEHPASYPAPGADAAVPLSADVAISVSRSHPAPEPGPGTAGTWDSFDPTSGDPISGDPAPVSEAPGTPACGETCDNAGPGPTDPEPRETPVIPLVKADAGDLLPANELVLGIESNNQSRAYPFSTISHRKIINDTVGGLDILVTFGPPSELAMMFNRNLDGQSLTFRTVAKLKNGIATMKDRQTGSVWEAITGRAISGPLAGGELERLTSEYSFWFSWRQAHPSTGVYG
jgi:hypothetical protein